jgi:hypothetical protein
MINSSIIFIGLDTHKEFVELAYIEDDRNAKVTHLGRARETAMKGLKDAKYQLKALLLRNNIKPTVTDYKQLLSASNVSNV